MDVGSYNDNSLFKMKYYAIQKQLDRAGLTTERTSDRRSHPVLRDRNPSG